MAAVAADVAEIFQCQQDPPRARAGEAGGVRRFGDRHPVVAGAECSQELHSPRQRLDRTSLLVGVARIVEVDGTAGFKRC